MQGQFRQLREKIEYPKTPWGKFMRQVFNGLARDSKVVRTKHLKGLGGQSYGSWVRKKLRDSDEVCILGAGQLVEEILPWLNKAHKKIKIFCRRPESIRDKFASYSDIEYFHLKDMNENIGEGSLVIAAPLSAEELSPVIASQPQLKTIVDLRGESKCDPLSHDHVVSLSSVFSEMEAAKTKVDSAVQKARAFIEELSLCS